MERSYYVLTAVAPPKLPSGNTNESISCEMGYETRLKGSFQPGPHGSLVESQWDYPESI